MSFPYLDFFVGQKRLVTEAEVLAAKSPQEQDALRRRWRLYLRQDPSVPSVSTMARALSDLNISVLREGESEIIVEMPTYEAPLSYLKTFRRETGERHSIYRQIPVWIIVKEERRKVSGPEEVRTKKQAREWYLIIDPHYLKVSGVTLDLFGSTLKRFRIEVLDEIPRLVLKVEERPGVFVDKDFGLALLVKLPSEASFSDSPSDFVLREYRQSREANQPRHLTEEEIGEILNSLPRVRSADKMTSESVLASIQEKLAVQLREIKITPLAFNDLKHEIITRFERSIIHPGTMVGINAAEALGGPMTQMTMNSVDSRERILISEGNKGKVVCIGKWIDDLLSANSEKVVSFPENRTEYLELKDLVYVPSVNETGETGWHRILAVTRHLPSGDLVSIQTRSGRTVTATQQKSFLIFDEEKKKICEKNGRDLSMGDRVPITFFLPDPERVGTVVNLRTYLDVEGQDSSDEKVLESLPLDEELGFVVGMYLARGRWEDTLLHIDGDDRRVVDRVCRWCDKYGIKYFLTSQGTDLKISSSLFVRGLKRWCGDDSQKRVPEEAYTASRDFIRGLLDGYFSGKGQISETDGSLEGISTSEELILGILSLLSRLGIFGEKEVCKEESFRNHMCRIRGFFGEEFERKVGLTSSKRIKLREVLSSGTRCVSETTYEIYSNVVLDPIVKISREKASERYVYDLTVETTKNFTLWNAVNCADTFHVSGSSKAASYGIEGIRELLDVSEERKHKLCTIFFKDSTLTFDEVYAKREDLVEVKVSDLIRDYDIDQPKNLEMYWWHHIYPKVTGKTLPQSTWVLRLYFDVNLLYSYKVTMEQIVESIESKSPDTRALFCVASPISQGIIDVYPDERRIAEPLLERALFSPVYASITYLTTLVIPGLDNILIKGIPGIRSIHPVTANVWGKTVRDEIRAFSDANIEEYKDNPEVQDNMRRTWILLLNVYQMKATGVSTRNLINLCRAVGMEILYDDTVRADPEETEESIRQRIVVQMPEIPEGLREVLLKQKIDLRIPSRWVQYKIKEDQEAAEAEIAKQRAAGKRFYVHPPSAIARAATFTYAEATGSNLRALLARDDIDPTHTISNSVHEVYRTLGIEAARLFLIKEFIDIISHHGDYINPRHITLLVDFMTRLGTPLPISFTGVARQAVGTFSTASFQRSADIFRDAAGFGTLESLKGVSANIFVGKRAEIGTGSFDVMVDEEKVEEFIKKMKKQPERKVDENAFKILSDTLEELTFGTESLQFEETNMEDSEDPATYLFGPATSEVIPSVTPPVTIGENITSGNISTIKTKPVISPQMKAVLPQLSSVPSYPEPSPPTVVVQTQPSSAVSTPLPGGPLKQSRPDITETGVGVPPALVSALQTVPPKETLPIPQEPQGPSPLPLTGQPGLETEVSQTGSQMPMPTALPPTTVPEPPTISLTTPAKPIPREVSRVRRMNASAFLASRKK